MEIKYFKKDILNQPKIIFRESAYATIKKYMLTTHGKSKEFMFYGLVEKRVGNSFIIDRFELMPNKATSGAYCEADDERMGEWFMETFSDPRDMKRVRCHAHSHVNMATNPSGTDDAEILRLASNISDYYIQLIVNHKDENTCNIFDNVTGISYMKVPQFIQIGNYAIDFKEGDIYNWNEDKLEISNATISIANGDYEVKDNWLILDDWLSLNLLSKEFVLDGGFLCIEGTDIAVYESDEEAKEMEKLFDEMIKKPTYSYPNSTYTGSSYGGNYYGSYGKSNTKSTPSTTPSKGWGYSDDGYDDDDYGNYYYGGYEGYRQSRGMFPDDEDDNSNKNTKSSNKGQEKNKQTKTILNVQNLNIKK